MKQSGWSGVVLRWRWRILASALGVLIVSAVIGVGTPEALSLSRFAAAGSESDRAASLLLSQSGTGSANVALMVIPQGETVDDPEVAAHGQQLTDRLASWPGVAEAWSYWSDGASTLRSDDGAAAWILAVVPGDADHVRSDILPGIVDEFTVTDGDVRVVVAGADEVFREVAEQSRSDFLRAELIILPLVLLLLWGIYRRFRLALLTLGLGFLAVFGALAILRVVTQFAEVSTFASNIVLVLGIGLGVDYGLFIVFRYREELRRTASVDEALAATVRGAGRTVFFSGLTVAAALSVLFVFPYPFLSSFAYAGIAVVAVAVAGALIVLPAGLAVLGRRAERRHPNQRPLEAGAWFRIPAAVMRRPVLLGGAGLIVVLALAAPVIGITFGVADDRVLPASAPVRVAYDLERAGFEGQDSDALLVVTDERIDQDALESYAAELSLVDGVLRVDTATASFSNGGALDTPPSGRFTASDAGTWLGVIPSSDALNADPAGLVREVRAVEAPVDVLVGGYPAELIDYRDGVTSYLPLAAALIILVTFIVLFLMTGSVIVPLQVSALNLLSMAVMFAVLVWGFQHGGLAWLTGFTPTGSIEPSIPILMFCIAYGLSTDYAVFVISRIKEAHDRTGDAVASVPQGIARSGPLVTAAAVTLAATFLVYATGQVVFLQQLGIGMAVAVLVDATLIRAVLLPALMRASGRLTWSAPRPLRWVHDRFGLAEG